VKNEITWQNLNINLVKSLLNLSQHFEGSFKIIHGLIKKELAYEPDTIKKALSSFQ
jgi:hypothetical protein